MLRIIRQMWRGCFELPHVGHHPGTEFLFVMIACGAIVGATNESFPPVIGFFVGAIFMSISVGAFYLYGAYSRAELSDHLEKKKQWCAGR